MISACNFQELAFCLWAPSCSINAEYSLATNMTHASIGEEEEEDRPTKDKKLFGKRNNGKNSFGLNNAQD